MNRHRHPTASPHDSSCGLVCVSAGRAAQRARSCGSARRNELTASVALMTDTSKSQAVQRSRPAGAPMSMPSQSFEDRTFAKIEGVAETLFGVLAADESCVEVWSQDRTSMIVHRCDTTIEAIRWIATRIERDCCES